MTQINASIQKVFGEDAIRICRTLQLAGHDAVIVGGPVRDVLLGNTKPNDIDIATSARPDEVRRLFPRTFVQGKGEKHGTIGVLMGDEAYEVTTFRRDVETDGRHATVDFTNSLEEDLARRDFTINAMAIRPRADGGSDLIDPFGGQQDLAARRLRTVGSADERFREDYLRILRAYRFAARLGLRMDGELRAAVRRQVAGLDQISRERVQAEFIKMMGSAKDPRALIRSLRAMVSDGVMASVLPEVAHAEPVTQNHHHRFRVGKHLRRAAAATTHERPLLRFAMLLHDIGKPATRSADETGAVHFYGHETEGAWMARAVMQRLKFSAAERDWVTEIVAQHMRLLNLKEDTTERALRRIAASLGAGVTLEDLLEVRIADKRGSGKAEREVEEASAERVRAVLAKWQQDGAALSMKDLAINGSDLLAMGFPQGKQMGEVLRDLLARVIDDPALNEKETLAHLADTIWQERHGELPASRRTRAGR